MKIDIDHSGAINETEFLSLSPQIFRPWAQIPDWTPFFFKNSGSIDQAAFTGAFKDFLSLQSKKAMKLSEVAVLKEILPLIKTLPLEKLSNLETRLKFLNITPESKPGDRKHRWDSNSFSFSVSQPLDILICETGYHQFVDKCIKCEGKYYLNTVEDTCYLCDENCVECQSEQVCNRCNPMYFVVDGFCVSSSPCGERCANCKKGKCVACRPGNFK